RLRKLRFQLDAVSDVIHNEDGADDAEIARQQRRDGDVGDAGVARRRSQAELVQIVNAGILPHAVKLLHQRAGQYFANGTAERLRAGQGVHHFHLRVPGLDVVVQIHRQHTYADGFHDVFVEVFERLVGQRLVLQRGIKPGVLDSNADVSRQRLQQLNVFAGEEIALHGLA